MTPTYLLILVVAALATARVYLLLTKDDVTIWLRNLVQRARSHWLNEGFYCPFCLGFWISLAFVWVGLHVYSEFTWYGLISGSLAVNYASVLLLKLAED